MPSDQIYKGQEVNLTARDPGLRTAFVGIGWDAPEQYEGYAVDIDASAFVLKRDGKVRSDTDFVFYNNLIAADQAVRHNGDNITGFGEGDDEVIEVDLNVLPYDVDRISFAVTVHNAEERGQTFGLIKNAFIRVVNKQTGVELARFDLSEDASDENGMVFGEIFRNGPDWNFRAIGEGTNGGLYRIARNYGVNVAPP